MFILQSNIIPLLGVAETKQGGRPENQDDLGFVETSLGFLLVVCDGMGGGPGGKTASYIAKYEIMKSLCECDSQMQRGSALRMAIGKANDALADKVRQIPALAGMGATLVAILINRQSAVIAHVGDSRCYRIHKNRMVFCTQDHSLVGELVRKKVLTPEQARTSPQSNIVSRNLGHPINNVPQIDEVPFKKGDRFVLCTDGVWGAMPHEMLVKRLVAKDAVQKIVGNLSLEIDQIGFSEGGHHDNHTLGIIELKCDSLMKDKKDFYKRILQIFSLLVIVVGAVLLFSTHKETSQPIASNPGLSTPAGAAGMGGGEQQPTADSSHPKDTVKQRILKPIEQIRDSLSKDSAKHNSKTKKDSVNKNVDKKKESVQEKKIAKTKAVCKALDKINEHLDSMLSCKGKKGEVKVKNEKRLEKIKTLMKQIKDKDLPQAGESVWTGTKEYIDKNAVEMVKESPKDKNKVEGYVTSVGAQKIIRRVKKNVERLNNIIRYGNDKTSR